MLLIIKNKYIFCFELVNRRKVEYILRFNEI